MGRNKFCTQCTREYALPDDLIASEQRNRELTRQVEQLQARVDVAEKLLRGSSAWMNKHMDCNSCYGIVERIKEWLAITAPPSSAPTDPGRADTGNEK